MINIRKYHGAGNDFILIKDLYGISDIEDFARKVCHRRYGIGADGIMFPTRSEKADIFMTYYNSDGSKGDMCGNGLRCFSRFVYDSGLINQKKFKVETLAGVMEVSLSDKDVTVNIGKPNMNPSSIPVITEKASFVREKINCEGKEFIVSAVLLGVPHCLVEVNSLDKNAVLEFGPILEKLQVFPKGANINFATVFNSEEISVDTWERGAGNTFACGTGSSACVYLLNYLGVVGKDVKVNVQGGTLFVKIGADDYILLTGNAEFIMDGTFNY